MRISMMKPVFCAALAALVLPAFCHVKEVHAGMFKEGWYMSRGKANMEIKNYKAAIEAFEKLVEINPNNREGCGSWGVLMNCRVLPIKQLSIMIVI